MPWLRARGRPLGVMSVDRSYHTATRLVDGRVLVTGDLDPSRSGPDLASAELYDPTTGTWSATGSMRVARNRHTATLLMDGRVLITSGFIQRRGAMDKRIRRGRLVWGLGLAAAVLLHSPGTPLFV